MSLQLIMIDYKIISSTLNLMSGQWPCHTYYGLAMREYTLFIATEVQLPLGRSVIISNGNNMSIALLKYIRIQ